jgi:2-aminoethylphosphonate-pyruvate transaminase
MLADYGSRDATFVEQVSFIRRTMLQIAEASEKDWACVLLQGPGTMGIEAAASTTTPRQGGRYLVLRSGKYAERMGEMTRRIGIDTVFFDTPEGLEIDLVALEAYLVANGPTLTNVGMVHHETSTGMLNPIQAVGALVRKYCRPDTVFIVDSMSAFGSVPCKVDDICDVLITSANKCLHGVPGFSIVLARRSLLTRCKGWSRSFTLDLSYQCAGLDKTGQFPFTPPVHTLMAFGVAVKEFLRDGGVAGRVARYKLLSEIVINGFTSIGFTLFLDLQNLSSFGRIVVAFNMPKHPKWDFKKFYLRLRKDGCIIYPGKASNAETFRVGLIGDLYEADMRRIVSAAEGYLVESGIGLGQNLDQFGHHNSDLPALRAKPSSSYTRKAKL